MTLSCWIGFDEREAIASDVCRYSLLRRSSIPLYVRYLKLETLRAAGLYSRESYERDGQRYDVIDEKPFSTSFAFSRFLVPALCQYDGWALFCDADFLFLADVAEILEHCDDSKAVLVCKQDHQPAEAQKMDGQLQSVYPRKNWSSLMLFNCSHPANRALTPGDVNQRPGSYLHRFQWLTDDLIGDLPPQWNFIEGVTPSAPKAVHFTAGGPWMKGHEAVRFAGEWVWHRDNMQRARLIVGAA